MLQGWNWFNACRQSFVWDFGFLQKIVVWIAFSIEYKISRTGTRKHFILFSKNGISDAESEEVTRKEVKDDEDCDGSNNAEAEGAGPEEGDKKSDPVSEDDDDDEDKHKKKKDNKTPITKEFKRKRAVKNELERERLKASQRRNRKREIAKDLLRRDRRGKADVDHRAGWDYSADLFIQATDRISCI